MIYIEEDQEGAEKDIYNDDIDSGFNFNGMSNNTITETHQRRIAVYGGTMTMMQSKTGQIVRCGTFLMRAKNSCNDLSDGRLVRVQIKSMGCTKEEFDRILDTFSVEHYISEH